MYKDILLHVDTANAMGHRQQAAQRLAERFNAHVTGLFVIEPLTIPAYAGMNLGADLLAEGQRASQEAADGARRSFERQMNSAGVASEWRLAEGLTSNVITTHGRYGDLVVLGQHDPAEGLGAGIVDDVVMSVGRPVLVVPYVGLRATLGRRILLAWNGSRESVRALHDAMGLLQAAEQVVVMSVNPAEDESRHIAGADISRHLARHGVEAVVNSTVSRDIEIGDTLLSRAADEDVDLIVMGAYGHSRIREMVLGGATRQILGHMTVPVLMSH